MGNYVTVEVDVELSDIDTEDLLEELMRRKRRNPKNFTFKLDEIPFEFKDTNELLQHLKKCLGLREFHDKERIIKEISEL